jgi:cytochrome P450
MASDRSRDRCPVESDYRVNRGDDLPPLWTVRNADALRERHDVFWAPEGDGYYVFTRFDATRAITQNTKVFSSRRSAPELPPREPKMIPSMLDPPLHTKWRQLLVSYFVPERVDALDGRMREACAELIDAVQPQGGCEFVDAFSSRFPAVIFLEMLGLSVDDDSLARCLALTTRAQRIATPDDPTGAGSADAQADVIAYLADIVRERRARSVARDDIIDRALEWRIDGRPLSDEEMLLCLLNLFLAGLDTVNAQLTYFFFHLATHDADRARLVRHPAVIPNAVEEMMRAYAIVRFGREVTTPFEIEGVHLEPGDLVFVATMSAGRDDARYERADVVDFDRADTRNLSFGAGPHHCLGSHLARKELAVALEEWHRRIPDYEIDDLRAITERNGHVCGLNVLPLRWKW